jgi:hypothetical protein
MAILTAPNPIPWPGSAVTRYGLFNAVGVRPEWEPHWADGGIVFEDEFCFLPRGYDVNCTDLLAPKTFDPQTTIPGTPFVVYAGVLCGSVGHTEAEFQAKALNRLKAGEQGAVEQIFSRQLNGQSRGLANSTPVPTIVVPLGATPSVADQVGALEEALYSTYGLRGVLHVPFQYGERLMAGHPLIKDGETWRTILGTAVSIGNYDGYSPAGVAPVAGHTWIYITGQTFVWRNPNPFVSDAAGSLNRTNNQVTYLAEREYIVTYECGAFALDVTF